MKTSTKIKDIDSINRISDISDSKSVRDSLPKFKKADIPKEEPKKKTNVFEDLDDLEDLMFWNFKTLIFNASNVFHNKTCSFYFFCIRQYLFSDFNCFSGSPFVCDYCINKYVTFGVEEESFHLVNPFYTKLLLFFGPHVNVMKFFKLLDPV